MLQKLKTRVMKANVNPEWNESFNLSVYDSNAPIHLVSIIIHLELFNTYIAKGVLH